MPSWFDPELDAGSWFDPELDAGSWFDPEMESLAVGAAARDYTWQFECGMTHQRTVNTRAMTGGGRFGIGFGDGFDISVRIVSVFDAADATGRWKAQIQIPQLSINEIDTGTPWNDGLKIRVEADQATLDATCGDAWEFNCDELRCIYNIGGGGDVELYNSGGPVTLSGTDYDPRENLMQGVPIHWLGTEDVQEEILPDFPGDWTDATYEVEGGWVFGWKYDATEPGAAIDETVTPPDINCDCEYALADFTLPAPPTTWDVTIDSGMRYFVDRIDEGVYDYYCDRNNLGLGTPGSIHIYKVEWEYHNQPTTLDLNADDEGLLNSIREAGARCFTDTYDEEDPYTITGPTTVTDATTYMAYRREVDNLIAYGYFYEDLILGTCPPLSEEEVRDPGHLGPTGEGFCYYQAYSSFTHDFACGEGVPGFISADTGHDKRRVVALFEGGGTVDVKVYDHGLNLLATNDLGFTANWVHVKIDQRTRPYEVLLFYELGGAIYLRISEDGGFTFGSAVTITTAGVKVTAEVSVDGTRYVYYITGAGPFNITGKRYDRGMNLLETAFTAISTVDNEGFAVSGASIDGGQHRLVMDYWVGGVHTVKTSIDGITFV